MIRGFGCRQCLLSWNRGGLWRREEGLVARGGGSDLCPPRHRAPAAPCALRTHVALLVHPCSAKKKGPSFFICRGGHRSLPPPQDVTVVRNSERHLTVDVA